MKKVKIDPFNPAWWAFNALQVVLIVIFTLIFKGTDYQVRRHFLIGFAAFSIMYFFFYKYLLWSDKNYPFRLPDEFPFQLCNLGTIFALVGAISENRFLLGYCCCIAPFGAMIAIVMPYYLFRNVGVFSKQSIGFYGHHGLIVVNGLLIFTLNMYQPDPSYTIPMTLFVGVLLCIAYCINVFVKKTFDTEPNYMFTYSTDHNPVLELLYKYIPYRLLYVMPLLPLVAIIHTIFVWISKI